MSTKSISDLFDLRASRREAIVGLAAFAATSLFAPLARAATAQGAVSSLMFASVPSKLAPEDALPVGYKRQILVRWGDDVLPGGAPFDPLKQSPEAQAVQFGFNNDYVGYFPLPRGSQSSDHGLLFVNHEYVSNELMFPKPTLETDLRDLINIAKAAHGGSVVEIERNQETWRVISGSSYARRITADTEIEISGPAAGDARMQTSYDPAGRMVRGMIANCSGGRTPWGTVLTAEENYQGYFASPGAANLSEREQRNAKRSRISDQNGWGLADPRFDLVHEPNEMNRFGWIVEIDPYDASKPPVKRTALGRFSHEAANTALAADGRVVVYLGDDSGGKTDNEGTAVAWGEYIYRFVTEQKFDASNRAANWGLLDSGILSVARFSEDKLQWLPLVFGQGPLTSENDFQSQADVVIEARRAADLLGATPMDRPEDIEASPVTGRVYVVLTAGRLRKGEHVDKANPRAEDPHGHILELVPPVSADGMIDHAADEFAWDVFLLAGDEASGATPQPHASLSMPDNCAFDPKGRLWIASDKTGRAQIDLDWPDGLYGCDTDGDARAQLKLFYAAPIGAEVTGPEFTPDGTTLFLAVQHPAEASSFEKPSTRWPDFKDDMPPRPSVIAITRKGGGPIGG